MLFIAGFGVLALLGLQKNFFPNIPQRNIYVDIIYPGASPEEIEEGAILKIEENIKGLANMERITSISRENFGTVTVEMKKGTDMEEALTKVKNEVERISSFPVDIESIVTYKHDNVNFAINFAVSAKDNQSTSLKELKKTARKIEHELMRKEGISKVEIGGYPDEEIGILLNEEALEGYQMTFQEVAKAVASTNLIMTGGSIKDGKEEFYIRARNREYHSEGLENVVIRNSPNGGVVRLKDVAKIVDRWKDAPAEVRFNNKQAVIISIMTTFDEDIIEASDLVKDYIQEFNEKEKILQAQVVRDQSDLVNQRIDLLEKNGIMGIVLVVIFLSLFLNPRIAFWVAIGIPFSMFGMFILLPMTNVTINMLSLFALILVLGILVDDAIVVAENIYRHWKMGKNPIKAAVDGTMEVMAAVVSGVLTTMIAFSAFLFLDGRMGDFFGEVGVIVISILFISLLEGLILLPSHIAHSKALTENNGSIWKKYLGKVETGLESYRDKIHRPLLEYAIHYKSVTIAIFTALFIISIGMMRNNFVTFTFFPDVDGDNFTVTLALPSGTDESVTQKELDKISNAIWEVNEELKPSQPDGASIIKKIFQQFRGSGNNATIDITLLDAEIRTSSSEEVMKRIRKKVGDIPGAEVFQIDKFNPFGKAIMISLTGEDNDELQAAKEELKLAMKTMPEISDVSDNSPIGHREIEIELKEKAHLLGITLRDVISQVRQGFFGYEVQRLQRGKDEVRVWVKYSDENRRSIGQLETMKYRLPNGLAYPLSELVIFKTVNGVANIRHLEFDREVQIQANQSSAKLSLPETLEKIEKNILQPIYKKYPGVKANYDGQKRETDKVAKSARIVMPIILLLMFFIVIITLRSVTQSILVYAMIPLAFIGVVFGHWIHGMNINIMSMMGMIALVGVMINDALVLINALNINLKEGMKYEQALIEAGTSRFRPILLTTLTTVVGMAPMVLEKSLQAQFLIPVSLSLAYGMIVATTTTLFLLPVMLLIVNKLKVKWHSFTSGRKVSNEEVENAIKEMKYNYDEI